MLTNPPDYGYIREFLLQFVVYSYQILFRRNMLEEFQSLKMDYWPFLSEKKLKGLYDLLYGSFNRS